MTNHEAASGLEQRIIDLCEQYQAVSLYVFGSQAPSISESIRAGTPPKLSTGHDVDIGVKLRPSHLLTTREKVELAQQFESIFGAVRVDLVFLDEVDPFLAANIIRGERLFAANSLVSDEYELYILRRAGDLAPYERERINLILRDKSA